MKGTVDTVINIQALERVVVQGKIYQRNTNAAASEISKICADMMDESHGYLSGGDGDTIRENFEYLSKACTALRASTNTIVSEVDAHIAPALAMQNGKTMVNADSAAKAAKKTGVLKGKE